MDGLLMQCATSGANDQPQPPYATFFAKQFFVSWSGVLTLVYTGFPQSILSLKSFLESRCPTLAQEHPGSKWPKTSLAAVNDENANISKGQLEILHEICVAANSLLTGQGADQCPIQFNSFSYVHFQNRFVRSYKTLYVIPDELQNTDRVVEQASHPDYWKYVAKPGNRRSHYTLPASGTTLCCFLADADADAPASQQRQRLLDCVRIFQSMVDQKLPGVYSFFPEESLHITLRGIS